MKAMILAAGLGTRLRPITESIPKALAPIKSKTLLEINILYLQQHGIFDIIINVHHFANKIELYLKEHNNFGSNITLSDERDLLLDTGGGVKKAAHFFEDESAFLVMNVDILTNLDINKMLSFHFKNEYFGTLAVQQRASSRKLLFDEQMALSGWENIQKQERKIARDCNNLQQFAFSGISILSPKILYDLPFEGKFSLIDLYLFQAKTNILKGYDHTGDLLIDVGKPESMLVAEGYF